MKTVQLTDEQRATLTRNLSADKRVINAQRREAKRQRDEDRRRARAQKALDLVAQMSNRQPTTDNPNIMNCVAACIDRFPVKIGRTWVR